MESSLVTYSHVIADLLDMDTDLRVESLCAHHSQGDVEIQNFLQRSTWNALRESGARDPKNPTIDERIYSAAMIRERHPEDRYTSRIRLSRIFHLAATWITERREAYGPARMDVGNDIVDAIGVCADSLNERYDALTVIVQSIPAQTITDWEWNINEADAQGAIDLLRDLAANPPRQRRVGQMHPAAPAPVHLTVNLESPAIRDMAAKATGRPVPAPSGEAKRDLIRSYKEASAEARGVHAEHLQREADDLRN